jgi:hypothetical protein
MHEWEDHILWDVQEEAWIFAVKVNMNALKWKENGSCEVTEPETANRIGEKGETGETEQSQETH